MRELKVDLGDRSYPIYIGENLIGNADILKPHIPGRSVMVVSNTTVAPLYLDKLLSSLDGFNVHSCILPDGERFKTIETWSSILDALMEARLDRKTTVIALGGGVIGDIAGFAAASYQRGVHFIQIPTTLLSQVDSSVGGKTGVNHPGGKNMVGAFYQPRCVIADTASLDTLPDNELSAGLAEVIKYGLIRDPAFHAWLEAHMDALMGRDKQALADAIERSCRNKAEVVAADEREAGQRALLNLGHTFGHAIENSLGYGEWLHGEAVGCGMSMAADLSTRMGWMKPAEREAVDQLLRRAKLPIESPTGVSAETYMDRMAVDKKVEDGNVRLVLMKGIGRSVISDDYDRQQLAAMLEERCR